MASLRLTEFTRLLEQLTGEFQQLRRVVNLSRDAAFESMLEQVHEALATLPPGARIGLMPYANSTIPVVAPA